MPPKKKVEVEEEVLLGRPGNSLKMGIVGMPNVGKSTLYNTLAKLDVPAENYPFCTIDPNEARVPVPDEGWEWLVEKWQPASRVPAALQITDIAGLIRGASNGEGLGNAFLSHIRAVDAIFQVVRIFDDADVTHVEESVDPVRDMEIIRDELILKDVEYVGGAIERAQQAQRHQPNKEAAAEEAFLVEIKGLLEEGKQVRYAKKWAAKDVEVLNKHNFLTAKTVVYLVNMSERDFLRQRNSWLPKIKAWIDANSAGASIIPYCGSLESELSGLEDDAARAAMQDEKKFKSVIPKIIATGYSTLNLVQFFTAGTDEVRAWTIRRGTKAPGAGGVIHTDFEKAFICAEVTPFEDFKELGSDAACRAAGKQRQQGKDYVVQSGDIILFKVGQIKKTGK